MCDCVCFKGYEDEMEDQPSSHRLAQSMGVSAQNMQVMKASFFHEEDAPPQQGMIQVILNLYGHTTCMCQLVVSWW